MSLRTFFVALSIFTASSALLGCMGSAACDCGPSIANPLDMDEMTIVSDLNRDRVKAGLQAVAPCFSLNVSAAGHSDDMRNNTYLAEQSPLDGSDVRSRACKAGYSAACGTSIAMAELVAEGNPTGDSTYMQWSGDSTAEMHLMNPGFVVVGLGHSQGLDNVYWTLDLSSVNDPSCNQQ
jgi:uncharacterized protein YkwD